MLNLLLLVLIDFTVSISPWFHILWVLICDETSQCKVLYAFRKLLILNNAPITENMNRLHT